MQGCLIQKSHTVKDWYVIHHWCKVQKYSYNFRDIELQLHEDMKSHVCSLQASRPMYYCIGTSQIKWQFDYSDDLIKMLYITINDCVRYCTLYRYSCLWPVCRLQVVNAVYLCVCCVCSTMKGLRTILISVCLELDQRLPCLRILHHM